MNDLSNFANLYLNGALIFLCLMLALCVIRAITGRDIASRILGVSMICTLTVIMIAVLSALIGESYLLDIAILFALLSVLIIEVITKAFIKKKPKNGGHSDDN